MRMIRLYCDAPLAAHGLAVIRDDAALHARRVLRLETGDKVVLFNGDGWDYHGTLAKPQGDRFLPVVLGERSAAAAESPLALTLVQGISRGDRMDIVLQKATELGVARIVPVISERSIVRLDAEQAERKLAHWQGIVIAACGQCGRARIPEVAAPIKLDAWLALSRPAGPRLMLALGAKRPLTTAVTGATAVELLIGPEGGLSSVEQAAAAFVGFEPVLLGPRTLRTETAAIAALAVLQSAAGDLALPPA
ncbi:MAG: 16S rRNA (uracil(1498)-N(3))-methyltransferase [Steroidobacteraceae bacterium]|nr:16S rRNA (uracil(1498)-N(3))-methyltransferase [Steroidobacteraceae bacterium]MCC7198115.1 16S rRNA (uracil(1498)-N(3))-methyltransferase [Gammaproteobacteria bacterium]